MSFPPLPPNANAFGDIKPPLRCRWFGHAWKFGRYGISGAWVDVRCGRVGCGVVAVQFRQAVVEPAGDLRVTMTADASQMNAELDRVTAKLERIQELSKACRIKISGRSRK